MELAGAAETSREVDLGLDRSCLIMRLGTCADSSLLDGLLCTESKLCQQWLRLQVTTMLRGLPRVGHAPS